MKLYIYKTVLLILMALASILLAENPTGFQNADWGASPSAVKTASGVNFTPNATAVAQFPAGLGVTVFSGATTVAGYPVTADYYFYNNKFFQAVLHFNFPELVNFDFNYNVYISVDKYYREIHDKTLTFVDDIYALLRKKYGKKQPIFEGLDPKNSFVYTDRYINQEVWNLRYHPSTYYKKIKTASYARWDFPKTQVAFSVNISAIDKRFDYTLSLSSNDLVREVEKAKESLRMQGL